MIRILPILCVATFIAACSSNKSSTEEQQTSVSVAADSVQSYGKFEVDPTAPFKPDNSCDIDKPQHIIDNLSSASWEIFLVSELTDGKLEQTQQEYRIVDANHSADFTQLHWVATEEVKDLAGQIIGVPAHMSAEADLPNEKYKTYYYTRSFGTDYLSRPGYNATGDDKKCRFISDSSEVTTVQIGSYTPDWQNSHKGYNMPARQTLTTQNGKFVCGDAQGTPATSEKIQIESREVPNLIWMQFTDCGPGTLVLERSTVKTDAGEYVQFYQRHITDFENYGGLRN